MPDDPQPLNLDEMDFGPTIRGNQKGDRVFERFVLQRLLGRGGMGVVWLAVDERLRRDVALKFAPQVVRYDDLAVEELKEETRKGLDLAHPHIVKTYDFLMDEENAAISMEYIDGEHLGSLRAKQPNKIFETRELEKWIGQLLDALQYAHLTAEVIHRDLKPANLMVHRDGNLRVTDFGIARSISDALNRATLMGGNSTGTLAYMSPQQAEGRKPRISDDVYAVGSTLYELLTGKPPFYSGNISQQLRQIAVTPLTARRQEFDLSQTEPIPAAWEETIMACLEKDPANRPVNAAEVRARLGLGASPSAYQDTTGGTAVRFTSPLATSPSQPPTTVEQSPPTAHNTGRKTSAWRQEVYGTQQAAPLPQRAAQTMTANPVTQTRQTTSTAPATSAAEPQKSSKAATWIILAFVLLVTLFLGGVGWWGMKKLGFLGKKPEVVVKNNIPTPPPPVPDPKTPTPDPGPAPDRDPTPPVPPGPTPPMPPNPEPPAPGVFVIQAAIDKAEPGSTVIIPAGEYAEQLRFKSGINLKAEEPRRVVVHTDGRFGPALTVENCEAGTISGIVFEHERGDLPDSPNPWPVVSLKTSNVVFEDCTIRQGVGDGATATGVSKPVFRNVRVHGNPRNGLVLEAGVTGSVTGSEFYENGLNGIEVRKVGSAPEIKDCTLRDNGRSGLLVNDGAKATVTGKTVARLNKNAGVMAVGDDSILDVNGGEYTSNQVGISLQTGARGTIMEALINDSKEVGIFLKMASTGSILKNNDIKDNQGGGIEAFGGNGAVLIITTNKIQVNGGHGIIVSGANFKPEITRNECLQNVEVGIVAHSGVGGVIKDNITRGNNAQSIFLKDAAPDLVVEGNQDLPVEAEASAPPAPAPAPEGGN